MKEIKIQQCFGAAILLVIVWLSALFAGWGTYTTGCRKITQKCYSPDKFVGIIMENNFVSYNCTQDTINGLTPYDAKCAEYDTTPLCKYSHIRDCTGNNIYYKCIKYDTYYCFTNTLNISYGNNQTCIVSHQGLISNATIDDQYVGTNINVFVDDKNRCSIVNNYIVNYNSLIGFCVMMFACLIAILSVVHCVNHCKKNHETNETTVTNPIHPGVWNNVHL